MATPTEEPVTGPTEDFLRDEIVVDLPYLPLVTDVLGKLQPQVPAVIVSTDDILGLALLSLKNVDGYAAVHGIPRFDGAESLDAVLWALRSRLTFGEWVVEMGKNRYMHQGVVGFPQSKPLSSGDPEHATPERMQHTAGLTAGDGVRVGVLDTRLFPHPDLEGHYLAEPEDLLTPEANSVPKWKGHATFVTGLIVAKAPAAKVVVRAVLNDDNGWASAWKTAAAMARFPDVDVLNLSLGCRTKDGRPPLVMRRAIEVLGRRMVVVAAAGNHQRTEYKTAPTWPAALPGVVAVGATNDHGLSHGTFHLADFSPKLPWIACVARGETLVSTYLNGWVQVHNAKGHPTDEEFTGYASWSGTSFSAAIVSGAIAAGTKPPGAGTKPPGRVTARESLYRLLTTPNPLVTRYIGG